MSFAEHSTLRRAVFVVALLNLAYFGVEFAVALAIGSVSLFADSIDFLEDALINLLIFIALSWSCRAPRAFSAWRWPDPAYSGSCDAVDRLGEILAPAPPAPCAFSLAGFRRAGGESQLRLSCSPAIATMRQPDHARRFCPPATRHSPIWRSSRRDW